MRRDYQAVVVGVSAGALDALSQVLPALPSSYPLPIIVVVHLPVDKDSMLAELLQKKCRIKVIEAEDKLSLEPGYAYIAPPGYHLLVENNRILSLSTEEPVLFSRPSIDVLFEAASDAYGSSLIGVILTGANQDGAKGLKVICDGGGMALVQAPETAYASAMPQAAMASCPDAKILNLEQIAAFLQEAVQS